MYNIPTASFERPTRRRFLYSLGGLTLGGLALGGLAARHMATSVPLQWRTSTRQALGTSVSLTLGDGDDVRLERATTAAFRELERIESIMSLYRADSQIAQLNRHGVIARADRRLMSVMRAADAMWRDTEGAFDATVQPLWDLYANHHRQGTTPNEREVAATRQRVDWRQVMLGDQSLRFRGDRVSITLNGIAQGYATDRVATILRRHGIVHALIDVGEIAAWGQNQRHEPWHIGIQHPREPDAYIATLSLDNRCLATSGDYATVFDEQQGCHHLLDPRTGRSPQELSSVSVLAPTALEADGLSTALMVLGVERGTQLVRQRVGIDVMMVTRTGRVLQTPGFPPATAVSDLV